MTDPAGSPLPFDQTPQQRAARGEAFTMSFVLTDPDGARRWYEAIGQPTPGGTDTQRGVITIRDITERSLRHMQDEWLALAGHELRTPLTALQASIQLAARALPDGDGNQRTRRHLDQSVHHVRRIGALVEQMIDTARIQSTRIGITQTDQALAPIVEQAVETARTLSPNQPIRLTLPGETLHVSVDASRIEQVLLNVLTNAIAYASKGEAIDVRVCKTEQQVEIEVEDRGPGIPPEQLDSIFNRYQRVDRPSRQSLRGLGLGLFIAREIMSEHEGTISARSVVGEGSILTLRLPLIQDPDASSNTSP
jgi:two-component system CheB/CheR fusion protein